VRGCLAGLGTSAYIALVALEKKQLYVRLDACNDCPLYENQKTIRDFVANAKTLLGIFGFSDQSIKINLIIDTTGFMNKRPIWDAHNPPMTRRDLFKLASQQGQISAARMMAKDISTEEKRTGRERIRLVNSLSMLSDKSPDHKRSLPKNLNFALLSILDTCTACNVCVRGCPTNALQLQINNEPPTFSVTFIPKNCIACKICQNVCAVDSIRINGNVTPELIIQEKPMILVHGEWKKCKNCRTLIPANHNKDICPLCEFRRENPIGMKIPPGLEKLLGRKKS
jgi:ferredoxin